MQMSKAKFVHARGEKSHLKKNNLVKPHELYKFRFVHLYSSCGLTKSFYFSVLMINE